MAEPRSNLKPLRINPTTPERQVAAFAVELDKLVYRFTQEFDIEPEDYAATLMDAADDVLHRADAQQDSVVVRFLDGPLAGELYQFGYPPDYNGEAVLYHQIQGASYRMTRLATGMWQGVVV